MSDSQKWERAVAKIVREQSVEWTDNRADLVVALLHRCCESPIERLLGAYLLTLQYPANERHTKIWPVRELEVAEATAIFVRYVSRALDFDQDGPRPITVIFPQAIVDSFRVDFLVVSADFETPEHVIGPVCVAVEADGHDFHEKTKEQAMRDKKRDRQLVTAGLHVLRFTGSEIYRRPRRCAAEVDHLLLRLFYPDRFRVFDEPETDD